MTCIARATNVNVNGRVYVYVRYFSHVGDAAGARFHTFKTVKFAAAGYRLSNHANIG